MMHKHARKVPRFHPGLEWEGRTLSNDFIDINRMALDDSFSGKNAAPLSKRRNGIGYTDGKTPGLFGYGSDGWTRILENKDAANYTSAQDVIDAYKSRIISKRDASNVLLNKFLWSTEDVFMHMDLAEYVSGQRADGQVPHTEMHPDHSTYDTDVDNTLPVQVQTQEVVPAGRSFKNPRSAYFLGGLIAVGAYTALDYMTYKPNQSPLRRMINRTPSSLIVGAVAFSFFAPTGA